jgi:hypothetical protein
MGNTGSISRGNTSFRDKKFATSYGNGFMNTSQSFVDSQNGLKSVRVNSFRSKPSEDSLVSDGKPFMHKRLGPNFDPTVISAFPYGSPQFNEDLEHNINQNNKARASKLKVENSVGENLY